MGARVGQVFLLLPLFSAICSRAANPLSCGSKTLSHRTKSNLSEFAKLSPFFASSNPYPFANRNNLPKPKNVAFLAKKVKPAVSG
jgi:hypothetical protein